MTPTRAVTLAACAALLAPCAIAADAAKPPVKTAGKPAAHSTAGKPTVHATAGTKPAMSSADKMMATNEAGPVTILASGAHAVYMADGVVASLILWVPASGSISLVAKDSPKTKQVLVSVANEMLG